jgi:hypothetical protein
MNMTDLKIDIININNDKWWSKDGLYCVVD